MESHSPLQTRKMPFWGLLVTFTGVWVAALLGLAYLNPPDGGMPQQILYALVGATLLAGVATYAMAAYRHDEAEEAAAPAWVCPAAAGVLALTLFVAGYLFLGVWPVGVKSVMMVDLHHQYGPLLSELRQLLREGHLPTYSYHLGLGTNFIPAFAYYLASPINLLLLAFPERLLTEAVLVMTLIKGAAAAATFAACVRYIQRRNTTGAVAAGVMYALSGFMLAYSWNIMWLDGVVLLPVVVLCMERMLRTGKIPAYALTLALALFVNYYIGFMLCIFLVLYMAVWLCRRSRTGKQWLVGCGRFAAGSLLAGGLAACLLLPVALSLGRTSAAGSDWKEFASNFPLFELVGRFLYGATPTIRSGNLPNLYCGVPAVLLAPIYLSRKDISLRRRLCYGGLLAAMLLSCTVNQWDLLWHGLHSPNDLPYRFSFLVCFVLLLMAARVLSDPDKITLKQVGASLGGCAVYLVLWEMFAGDRGPSPLVLYTNLLLLAVYGVILLAGALKKAPRRVVSRLMLVAVCAELLLGTGDTLLQMNENEYFTNHDAYVDNANTAVISAAVKRVQELGREEMGEDFFRLEYLPRSTCVDTALHHYAGLTTFASSNPYQTTLFMGEVGYAINGVNSYLYHSFVAPTDSLLGLRYLILSSRITSHPQLTLLEEITVQGQTRYIYRNETALGLGYVASPDIATYYGSKYEPFACQERLYSALMGESVELYTQVEMTTESANAAANTACSFYVEGGEETAIFTGTITEKGQYFAYLDCRAADELSVLSYNEEGSPDNTWNVTTHEPYIIDMGTLQPGETVEAWVKSDTYASGNIYIVRLDVEEMTRCLDALRAGNLTVTAMTETHIEGTFTAAEDGTLLVTVPYDSGWTATVDGQPAETYPLAATTEGDDGALLCVRVGKGSHTVTLDYEAPGLWLGALVSAVSLLVLVGAWLIVLLVRRRRARKAVRAVLSAEEETFTLPEPMPEMPLPTSLEELMVDLPEDAPAEAAEAAAVETAGEAAQEVFPIFDPEYTARAADETAETPVEDASETPDEE